MGHAEQLKGEGAACNVEYKPVEQAMHDAEEDACNVVEYKPTAQSVQFVEANEGLYVPGLQFEHVRDVVAPTAVDRVPSTQA